MGEASTIIAYTVMTEDDRSDIVLLVEEENEEYHFPYIEQMTAQTGLATVIEALKHTMSLDFDHLELTELTNLVIDDYRVPFFIFTYHQAQADTHLIKTQSSLEWLAYEFMVDQLDDWNFSGVPAFN